MYIMKITTISPHNIIISNGQTKENYHVHCAFEYNVSLKYIHIGTFNDKNRILLLDDIIISCTVIVFLLLFSILQSLLQNLYNTVKLYCFEQKSIVLDIQIHIDFVYKYKIGSVFGTIYII